MEIVRGDAIKNDINYKIIFIIYATVKPHMFVTEELLFYGEFTLH